ncbi:MAG: hypothetical protein HYX68_16480 [Planctomycetes bacterium]|nr:hypothetical protein [Planctomycetota bacterium]
MKSRWILAGLLTFAACSFGFALAGGGLNFDFLTDADRAVMQKRFAKEVWPLMVRGGKEGCVGCHNGKIVSALKLSGNMEKDFRMMIKDGFFIPNDAGSLLTRIQSTNRKQKMPPPGRGDPWTKAEMKVLHAFVVDLEKKQQKKRK